MLCYDCICSGNNDQTPVWSFYDHSMSLNILHVKIGKIVYFLRNETNIWIESDMPLVIIFE